MEIQLIDDRLEVLGWVLQYCKNYQATFKTGERICINQERGSLLDKRAYVCGLKNFHDVREYKVNESIENRIQFTMNKILSNEKIKLQSNLITSNFLRDD